MSRIYLWPAVWVTCTLDAFVGNAAAGFAGSVLALYDKRALWKMASLWAVVIVVGGVACAENLNMQNWWKVIFAIFLPGIAEKQVSVVCQFLMLPLPNTNLTLHFVNTSKLSCCAVPTTKAFAAPETRCRYRRGIVDALQSCTAVTVMPLGEHNRSARVQIFVKSDKLDVILCENSCLNTSVQ